jgi:type II pantothenate kinase
MIGILKKNTMKIQLKDTSSIIPTTTVGIDIGQSLTKIAYLREEEIILNWAKTSSDFSSIDEFIESNKNLFNSINFTGGKCYLPYKKYADEYETKIFSEFDANIKGIEFLYKHTKNKLMPSSLVVTLGTGTSIVLKTDVISHIGGTAMGGGFFMGLIRLLFQNTIADYLDAISYANKGDRYQVDLKVGDIYNIDDNRVDKLFREFTAASLGKINENFEVNSTKKEDIILSLIGSIGENIGTIATLMAKNHELKHIFFCGGFLIRNKPLKQTLALICKYNGMKPIFLENSVFAGAIGALSSSFEK